ncbi:Fc.00g080860.m01.CDS01 [Cosmosporella sp. VM-42]
MRLLTYGGPEDYQGQRISNLRKPICSHEPFGSWPRFISTDGRGPFQNAAQPHTEGLVSGDGGIPNLALKRTVPLRQVYPSATYQKRPTNMCCCPLDFTANNIALRLTGEFDSYDEDGVYPLFGDPLIDDLRTYSRLPPRPHGPDHAVALPGLLSCSAKIFSESVHIIKFDQPFDTTSPPDRLAIPPKSLALKVAIGRQPSPAPDVWALGCAIFRAWPGEDLFVDCDTVALASALMEIVKTIGGLLDGWERHALMVTGLTHRKAVHHCGTLSAVLELEEPPASSRFQDYFQLRKPYFEAMDSIAWRPTTIFVEGVYLQGYLERDPKTDPVLTTFLRTSKSEGWLLLDQLSKVFSTTQGSG